MWLWPGVVGVVVLVMMGAGGGLNSTDDVSWHGLAPSVTPVTLVYFQFRWPDELTVSLGFNDYVLMYRGKVCTRTEAGSLITVWKVRLSGANFEWGEACQLACVTAECLDVNMFENHFTCSPLRESKQTNKPQNTTNKTTQQVAGISQLADWAKSNFWTWQQVAGWRLK